MNKGEVKTWEHDVDGCIITGIRGDIRHGCPELSIVCENKANGRRASAVLWERQCLYMSFWSDSRDRKRSLPRRYPHMPEDIVCFLIWMCVEMAGVYGAHKHGSVFAVKKSGKLVMYTGVEEDSSCVYWLCFVDHKGHRTVFSHYNAWRELRFVSDKGEIIAARQ